MVGRAAAMRASAMLRHHARCTRARTARFDVLVAGSRRTRTSRSTCSLVRDGEVVTVVDPGMSPSQEAILDPLRALGLEASDVTDVVISHHHPDHTINVALFPRAARPRPLGDLRLCRPVGRRRMRGSRAVPVDPPDPDDRATPTEDLSTVVGTPDGVVVFTHLWWTDAIPVEDPYARDPAVLHASRERVLGVRRPDRSGARHAVLTVRVDAAVIERMLRSNG